MYSKYNPGPRQRKIRNEKELMKLLEKKMYKAVHGGLPKQILSLQIESRIGYDEKDYESFREYGFLKGSEYWDDEDIREWVNSEWIEIHSPYDCTGKIFTAYIGYHRNPNGIISFVNCKSIDC